MEEYSHLPVLPKETLELMNIRENMAVLDCTLGGGGHTALFLTLGASVIGLDRDMDAINACRARFKDEKRFTAVHGSFFEAKELLAELGVTKVDGILADLGVSSYQLDTAERGFSYMHDGALDMRMDATQELSAYDVVNGYSEEKLARIIRDYGEERFAGRIAAAIVKRRAKANITGTLELAEIIKEAVPAAARRTGPHPAKRTFQAIRIEVNYELRPLEGAIFDLAELLSPGGRMCFISFHSLEDRVVKNAFRKLANPCTCPPKAPVCVCGKKPVAAIITKKPVTAGDEELAENPRARSAKLRAIEKLYTF